MISVNVDLSGIQAFEKFSKEFPGAVKDVLEKVTKDIRLKVKGETPFDTFQAKESWGDVIAEDGGFSFSSDVPYMKILEYGLYPGVGKVRKGYTRTRTVQTGTGIYSRQAVEGWVRKYLGSSELVEDIVAAITDRFNALLRT